MRNEGPSASDPSQAEINESEWANHANWKLGMFYASERDSRLWVPKKTLFGRKARFGSTPNMAKRAGRIYMLFLGGLLIGIILLLMVLKRLGIN